ncbi:MAG TPA: CdaR family protein [Bryobacteraceae bacterium]|nr:CdaR family protein [Bryobacteraceae bacterium]
MLRSFFHNFGWRVFALVIAIVLWATFVGSPELTTSVSAPVEYRNMPRGMEISSEAPERVYLEVQGPSARLNSFDLSNITVVFDLRSVNRTGDHTLTIESNNVDLQPGLTLVRAIPAQIRLRFERRVDADIPVRARLSGSPHAGYKVVRQEVNPPSLRIVGPESHVREVEYAETDPIDIANVLGTQSFQVQTFVRNPYVRLVSPPAVRVTVTVEKVQ